MTRFYILLLASFVFTKIANAQTISATTYPFSSSTGATPDDMSTGTIFLTGNNIDDGASSVNNIGFDFWFNGVRYYQFSANTNGLVRVGPAASGTTFSNAISGAVSGYIMPYWDDLWTGTNGKVHYKVTGTAPNRKLVIEWLNEQVPRVATNTLGSATFQCWLLETSGKIEFVYGNGMATNTGYSTTIGIANSSTVFASITSSATPSVSYTTANDANIAAITSGTKYTFTPIIPSTPTSMTFTSLSTTGMTVNWTDNASNEIGYAIYRSDDGGATYNFVSQTAANIGTYVETGLGSAFTYFWKVYAVSEGGLSAALSGSQATSSGSLSGTSTVGPTGTYASLTAAITALQASGISASIILELQATYVSTVETFPIIFANLPTSSGKTLTVRPASGATSLSITSSSATGTILLDGADYVTIDGRAAGAGSSQLSISNSSTSGYAIQYINSAMFNTVKYCTIASTNTGTTSGVIVFSTSTGLFGNSFNTIDNCDIRDGSTTPTNLIYASGTSTGYNTQNNNITISNSLLHDWFNASSTTSGAAINITGGCSDWTINANSFYQSAARTFTMTTATDQGAIMINAITFGFNFTITNNFIGGSAASCGGSALSWAGTGTTGTPTPRMLRIATNVGPFNNITGNTLSNMAFISASAATSYGLIAGLQGNMNISNNTIGSQTTTGNITCDNSGTSVAPFFLAISHGINATVSAYNITSNNIGGILLTTSSSGSFSFRVIYGQAPVGSSINISSNTIGGSVANSISQNTNNIFPGILILTATIGDVINNNTIRNMTLSNVGVTGSLTGINVQASGGGHIITGNSIFNLTTNGTNIAINNAASVVGITMTGQVIGGGNISGNTIYNLTNTNTSVAGWINGMYFATAGPPQPQTIIAKNLIHSINLSSPTGGMVGIFFPNVGNGLIYNNMIRLGVDASGSPITTSLQINGIYKVSSASVGVYFNTVYIGGAGVTSGTVNTYAFRRGTSGPADTVMNNIFYNARSNASGTGKNYAMNLNANTSIVCNYNDQLANGTGGVIGINGVTDYATLPIWQSATGLDIASISYDPQLLAPNGTAVTLNLHINIANPTPIEQAGFNLTQVTDDYDGQARSALSPVDIGADAGNFTFLDVSPPSITYIPLGFTCSTGNRALNGVTINDVTGMDISGTLRPRVYYNKNFGTYFSQPGTLVSGNGKNGSWNFTIVAADMGGLSVSDIVSYFIIAQDTGALTNISSNPGGVNATNVNTIITPPATPNSYSILANSLSGTYNVGTGQTYTTLTAAVIAYNTSCITGPVVFLLTDATYPSETFPITVNANPFASSVNTLTIKPGTGVNATLTGSSATAIIKWNGADFVNIDGSNNGTTSQNLTISNSNTAVTSGVLWLASVAFPADGANNNTIKNCVLTGNAATTTLAIIGSSGSIIAGIAEAANSNNTYQNNTMSLAQYGIAIVGNASASETGTVISNNTIGTAANPIGFRNLLITQETNTVITGNTIQNLTATVNLAAGIFLTGITTGVNISNNTIKNITSSFSATGTASISAISVNSTTNTNTIINANTITGIISTTSGGYGVRGIIILGSGTVVTNNMISDIYNFQDASVTLYGTLGITVDGAVTGIKIYHNTVNLFGSHAGFASNTTGGVSACMYINSTTAAGVDIRNNIFTNSYDNSSSTGDKAYAIYCLSLNTVFSNINNNDYFVSGSGLPVLGFLGSDLTTLALIQSTFGGNANSINFQPTFTSATDLHLTITPFINWCVNAIGVSGIGVPNDFDGDTRSATPDLGADEITLTATLTVTPPSQTICSGNITPIVLSGSATTYNWTRNNTATVTGIAASGSGSTISGSLINTTTSAVTVTFTITTIVGGCAGPSSTATVLVNPLPATFTFTGSPNAVSGPPYTSFSNTNATATYTVPIAAAGITYLWTITGGTISSGSTSNIVNVLWGPLNGSLGIIKLRETITATGCTKTDSILVSLGCATSAPPYTATTLALPTSVCQGTTLTYAVTPITGYQYKWVVTGGTIVGLASGTSVVVTWGGASTTASVRVIDSSNCAPSSNPINVTINGNPSALIAGPNTVCANSVINYSLGNISVSIATFTWVATGGAITTGQGTASVSVTWAAAGAGTLVCNMVSTFGCIGSTPIFAVTKNVNPAGTFTGTTTVCTGITYTYTATSSGNTYNWLPSGGVITAQSANTVNIVWSNVTSASLVLNETLGTGCSNSTTQAITVNGPLNATITGAAQVCLNATQTYAINGVAAISWSAIGGNVNSSNTTNATVTWNTSGTQSLTATYDNSGCTYSVTYLVNVNPLPAPTVSGPNAVCTGSVYNYTANTTSGSVLVWNVSSGGSIIFGQGTNTISVLWNSPGSGTVNVNETFVGSGCSVTSGAVIINVISSPSSAITGSAVVCSGVTFIYSAPAATSYAWTATGGTITGSSNASTVSVVWGTGISGSIKLVTTNGVCNSTTILPVNINITPTPSITGPNTICSGTSNSYSTGFNNTYGYSWNVINGTYTFGGNESAILVTPNTSATSVTISVTALINGSTCSGTITKVVPVNPTPIVSLSGNAIACQNSSQTYTATGANTYNFSVSGGVITATTANTVTITWGSFNGTVMVTGTTTAGCSASASKSITVNPIPTTVINGSTQVCANSISNFFVVSQNGATYSWSVTGGTIVGSSTSTSLTVNWGASGTGTVNLTANSALGCTDTRTLNISINSLPVPSITGITTVCQNTTQTYSITAIGGAAYNWSVIGGNIISGAGTNSVQVFWTTAGSGSVNVSQSNGICMGSAFSGITVNAAPGIPEVIRAGSILSTNAVATSYQWFNGTTPVAGATSSSHTVITAGTYTVVVTNAAGCSTSSNSVIANVGIKNTTAITNVHVYPTPATDMITITALLDKIQNVSTNIFDINGKLVYTGTQNNANVNFTKTISLEGYAGGVYVVQVITENGSVQQRIVKE